jgi:hypothetical protein
MTFLTGFRRACHSRRDQAAGPLDGEVGAIADRLRELVLAKGQAPSIKEGNEFTRTIQAYVLSIRDSAAGRQAVEALLRDTSPSVRLEAATSALKWNAKLALPVLEDLARHDKGLPGFEAKVFVREFEAGRLDLDWVPKPVARRQPRAKQRGPSSAQLDAVEAVHSTTMSGGFLNSLVASGPMFREAAAGYEALGLADAARLVRKALAVFPGGVAPEDHDRRAVLIDALSEAEGACLEGLSGEYQELFPTDTFLIDAMEALRRG